MFVYLLQEYFFIGGCFVAVPTQTSDQFGAAPPLQNPPNLRPVHSPPSLSLTDKDAEDVLAAAEGVATAAAADGPGRWPDRRRMAAFLSAIILWKGLSRMESYKKSILKLVNDSCAPRSELIALTDEQRKGQRNL